jgi:TonB family protein
MLTLMPPVLDPVKRPAPQPRQPRLMVPWESRGKQFRASLRVFLRSIPTKSGATPHYFRHTVEQRVPRGAIFASLLWHIACVAILGLPFWDRLLTPKVVLPPVQIEITWYAPARDLPSLNLPGPASKPSPPGEPHKPLPRRGADAYHPRQTILSVPLRITHPRQTLIQPNAPLAPPKIEPQLPNIVEWAASSEPARPHVRIKASASAPRQRRRRVEEAPVPEISNLEKTPGPLSIAATPAVNSQPKLPMLPATAARPQAQKAAADAGPAPDIGQAANGDANSRRLIALSASPAPVPPTIAVPQGNLSARVSVSPEGTQPGVPGGSSNGSASATGSAGGNAASPGGTGGSSGALRGTGGGNGTPGPNGVSINGGNASASSTVSGPTAPTAAPTSRASNSAAPPAKPRPEPVNSTGTPAMGMEEIGVGSAPEQILGDKRIYTLFVNMPNLSSATGSWVLNFTELQNETPASAAGLLSGPVPVRKVDPKYPPSLVNARVEGEVVLYAIIRRDGSVDSIQLLKGVDPTLDQNAMEALARWKFHPAMRSGAPVELETVVHIPFRTTPSL